MFFRFQVLWDIGFWLFAGCAPTRRGTQALLTRQSAPGLLRLIARTRPDVIVSTYPNMTEVLGRLRRAGRLQIPVCAAITDLAALDYWASPGVDVHLVTHPESMPEVRRIAGAATEIHCVHGFSLPEFRLPRPAAAARAALGLPADGAVVLVSGRRLGRRRRARRGRRGAAARGRDAGGLPVRAQRGRCTGASRRPSRPSRACGSRGSPIACPSGWRPSDVLVHSTCGLTVLEALMRGCPAVSYGWGRGHIRQQRRGAPPLRPRRRRGDPPRAAPALARAIDRPRRPDPRFADLPSAASFVLALADAARAPLKGD